MDQYVRAVRAHWILVAFLTVVGGASAVAYSLAQEPLYSASAELFVAASDNADNSGQLQQGGLFVQQRVKSYADIANSPTVMNAVIRDLGLTMSADQLASRVSARSQLDKVLLEITAVDASPERARDIANSAARAFPEFVNDLETPVDGTVSPVKIGDATCPNPRRSGIPENGVEYAGRSSRRSFCRRFRCVHA